MCLSLYLDNGRWIFYYEDAKKIESELLCFNRVRFFVLFFCVEFNFLICKQLKFLGNFCVCFLQICFLKSTGDS